MTTKKPTDSRNIEIETHSNLYNSPSNFFCKTILNSQGIVKSIIDPGDNFYRKALLKINGLSINMIVSSMLKDLLSIMD